MSRCVAGFGHVLRRAFLACFRAFSAGRNSDEPIVCCLCKDLQHLVFSHVWGIPVYQHGLVLVLSCIVLVRVINANEVTLTMRMGQADANVVNSVRVRVCGCGCGYI